MHETQPIEAWAVAWRLAVTLLFVLLNGFFVAAEFALVKVRPTRIEARAADGSASAVAVQHVLGRLDLYVVSMLRRVPRAGDEVRVGPYVATVLEVRQHRASRLRLKEQPAEREDS